MSGARKKATSGRLVAVDNGTAAAIVNPNFTTSASSRQASLALDTELESEDLHQTAAANLFAEARYLAILALHHANAAEQARHRRRRLERGIPV